MARRPADLRRRRRPSITRVPVKAPTAEREQLDVPGAARNRSFFLPGDAPRRPRRARTSARTSSTRSRSGLGDYFEKTGAFKTIGVALSGGRDSLLCLYLARRWVIAALRRPRARGREGEGARDPPRVLHALALLVEGDARGGRAGGEGPRRAVRGRLDRRRLRARARARREDAPARREARQHGAPERAGAHPRAAHVDVGEQRRRASSCRRAT